MVPLRCRNRTLPWSQLDTGLAPGRKGGYPSVIWTDFFNESPPETAYARHFLAETPRN